MDVHKVVPADAKNEKSRQHREVSPRPKVPPAVQPREAANEDPPDPSGGDARGRWADDRHDVAPSDQLLRLQPGLVLGPARRTWLIAERAEEDSKPAIEHNLNASLPADTSAELVNAQE